MSMLPCRRGYALRVGLWLPRDRLRGDGFECPVGFAGLYPAGKPLDRVPLGPTAHRAVGPSFLIFLGIIRGISLSAESDQRLCLWNPPAFWEKAGPKTWFCQHCGMFPTGCHNRRRAACRAANETWREEVGRGDMAAVTRRSLFNPGGGSGGGGSRRWSGGESRLPGAAGGLSRNRRPRPWYSGRRSPL